MSKKFVVLALAAFYLVLAEAGVEIEVLKKGKRGSRVLQ